MIKVPVLFFLLVFTSVTFAANGSASGGKGKTVGSVADSAHGSAGGGGSGGGRRYNDPRKAPPLDEARKVNEQDCSKPIDPQAGNLRCK